MDLADVKLFPEFARLGTPLLHDTPEADWDPKQFGRIPVWHGVTLDGPETLSVGTAWMNSIHQGPIYDRTLVRGLKLAMSLKSMDSGNNLFVQQFRGPTDTDETIARVTIPDMESFSADPYTLTAQDLVPVQTDAPSAYCFIAAYLMRLIIESPGKVVAGLSGMKSQYASFYGHSRVVARFNISLQQANAYKTALNLNRMALVSETFTHAVAYTHQYSLGGRSEREVAVIKYLGIEPFSYSGMRSYTLMMELKHFTNLELESVVELFHCPANQPALIKIVEIYINFERTVEYPLSDVTFRYCTLWGHHYFRSIRSKYCAYLLYAVACAWGVVSPGHRNSDPEKIFAARGLSVSMKEMMRDSGTTAGNTLKTMMLGGTQASYEPGDRGSWNLL